MEKKILKRIKIIVGILIIGFISWFFIIKPQIAFHSNESKMLAASKRYFELNSNELPSGERVRTVPLQKLYDSGLIDRDFYKPLSKKTCSNENSWVKVRRENGEYKYYIYLECGYLKSKVDHEGPRIILNGKEELTLNQNEKYKEQGVKSVVDKVDGDLKINDVTIRGKVDTSEIGTYEVNYIAYDKLNNKTITTRKVNVVRKIYKEVEKTLEKGETTFSGESENNYVMLSNMMFRIYGYDDNKNVILVSDEDLANVNYTKIDKWLEYFYNHLNDKTKEMIVEKKYCSMVLNDKELNKKKCEKYTKAKKVYIPSVVEVNNVEDGMFNFMKLGTMSWVADTKNNKEAYVTREIFFGSLEGKSFVAYSNKENYGVRPMFTIKGDSLIVSGDGEYDTPYSFGDSKKAKGGSLVSERNTGEYINIDGNRFIILKGEKDGTTKVISHQSLGIYQEEECAVSINKKAIEYNPKNKSSVAYCINNVAAEYIDTSHFVKHEIEVPIYEDDFIYGEEIKTKKYNVLFSAPNMYEMFSAQSAIGSRYSYWLLNSSQNPKKIAAIENEGIPVNGDVDYSSFGIRVVGYLKKGTVISSGDGTFVSPYTIK